MLLFQWNSLRVGDVVIVHDDSDSSAALHDGVVRIVEARRGGNDVAIRLDDERLVRPRRGAVHTAETGSRDCWRCHTLTGGRAAINRARLGIADLVSA